MRVPPERTHRGIKYADTGGHDGFRMAGTVAMSSDSVATVAGSQGGLRGHLRVLARVVTVWAAMLPRQGDGRRHLRHVGPR